MVIKLEAGMPYGLMSHSIIFVSVPPVTTLFPLFCNSSAIVRQLSTVLSQYSLYSGDIQYLNAIAREPIQLFCGAPMIPGNTESSTA